MSSEERHTSALGHLRVLDLAVAQTGYFGKVFADLGADVIKIEPPQGDPARRMAQLQHQQAERNPGPGDRRWTRVAPSTGLQR